MGFEACQRCAAHQRISGVADVVAPLVYAIAGTKSAALLRDYKNHLSRAVRDRCCQDIGSLVQSALSLHEGCLATAVGTPITVRITVPSLTCRPGVHPFAATATELGVIAGDDLLAPAPTTTCHRVVSEDKFVVTQADAVACRHVLVLDDIWTTGSNAQSAALALRRAGAAAVSVMVIGRWLNPSYPPTKAFLERHLDSAFDPHLRPVGGRACP
jgi:phosphoribosylpyrophosphate synthetase